MSDRLQANDEWVSALVDGQLQGDEFLRALDDLDARPGARQAWDDYQLVGQWLRAPATPLQAHAPAFVARLRQQIAQEEPLAVLDAPGLDQPVSGDVVPLTVAAAGAAASAVGVVKAPPAANDPWWRRVAGLASVALLAVFVWQGAGLISGAGGEAAPRLARAPLPAPANGTSLPAQPATVNLVALDGTSALMLRDPQLDALLAAHRQLGGASALQAPSGFLRNATFTEGQR